MGYRSDVILAVGPEVMPQFMVTMAKSPKARELCWSDHDEMIKDYNDEKGAFLFRWTGIKWYDSYEEIQAIQVLGRRWGTGQEGYRVPKLWTWRIHGGAQR